MSEVVLGVGASHSTLMNTHWDEVAHLPEAHDFRRGLEKAAEAIGEARPDAVVVIGSNHFRGIFLDLMPSLCIGVSEVLGAGEANTPAGALPVDRELAKHVVDHLVDAEFDPAFSLRLTVDHGITHGLQHLVPALEVPIVPVVLNMFAPPLMRMSRAAALGRALARALATDGADKRVVVIASGGLSHRLPWPDWSQTLSEDDRFLVEAWLNGRTQWREFEQRRRAIIRAAQPDINADFDRKFLADLERGDLSRFVAMTNNEIEVEAGNGAQELRSWVAMAAAVGPAHGTTLAYSPIDEWLTGMAVALYTPSEEDAQA
jgi:2,3-dihydroxyphenylpropionate 1,2-dioxygenase